MDNQHEDKLLLLSNHIDMISEYADKSIGSNIQGRKLENIKDTYGVNIDPLAVIGILDTTLMANGTRGCIFTDDKLYYLKNGEKLKAIYYHEIKEINVLVVGTSTEFLKITPYHGEYICINEPLLDYDELTKFLYRMKEYDSVSYQTEQPINSTKSTHAGAEAGGIGVGNYKTINNQYDEERFHASQGHGFAAERANNLYDKLTGHDAKIVGDDNAKNGADRIVDGVYLQSKYCATGSRCIKECFEDGGKGKFRYMLDNGKPMQIEVPSDKYADAVKAMEHKISNGQVEGVTDPKEAKNIVRQGHFTYEQAKNIAKAGTIESLTYDAANGMVVAGSAFGVTGMITFATELWNGAGFDHALERATRTGLKVGGMAFVTSVLAAQLNKSGLNNALKDSSERIAQLLSPKASAVLFNAFRIDQGSAHGAISDANLAKALRNSAISYGVSFAVITSVDVVELFRGRISGKQLFKNIATNAVGTAGGFAGWVAGSAVGSEVAKKVKDNMDSSGFKGSNLVESIIIKAGATVGSMIAGALAQKVTNAVLSEFVEDDAVEMVRIIGDVWKELTYRYLLTQREAKNIINNLRDKLDSNSNILKDMYASSNREQYAQTLLIQLIENEISKRSRVYISKAQQLKGVCKVLEEIGDSSMMDESNCVYV